MQVMCGVVSKLAGLHAAGYAHRQVALGSIVRARAEQDDESSRRWMLRDLNEVCKIGAPGSQEHAPCTVASPIRV